MAAQGRLKNPRGGLTEAGRAWFGRKQGAHLKPGVKKSQAQMTPQEMRRKGSWAVRFYGRKGILPPLRKPNGEPTRYALTAAAWGEPVPKTAAAAKRIAAKGRRLLAAYSKRSNAAAKKQRPIQRSAKNRAAGKTLATKTPSAARAAKTGLSTRKTKKKVGKKRRAARAPATEHSAERKAA